MDGFSIEDLRDAGVTKRRVEHMVAGGSVVRITRGAYVLAERAAYLESRSQALGRLLHDHAVICRRTAAWLWGLDVLPPGQSSWLWPVELVVPRDRMSPRRPGVVAYQADLPAADVAEVAGVLVTTRLRTAVDCARYFPRLQAVAALDQFLRCGVDPAALAERAGALAGQRNVCQLREVIELSDCGAESPGESRIRALVVDAGFPRPSTQVPVVGRYGQSLFLDMGFEEYRIAIEYDGEEHHSGAADRAHDAERRAWIRSQGWEVLIADKSTAFGDPRPFLEALATTLLDRGWQPADDQMNKVAAYLTFASYRRAA